MSGDDLQKIIQLTFDMQKLSSQAQLAFEELKEHARELERFTESLRIEQRTDVEKYLEIALMVLFELERVTVGEMEGFDHYSITNDRHNSSGIEWSQEKLNRTLEEVQLSFINKVVELIQKPLADGRKILVRVLPEYRMSEEGYHFFRCRLLIEKVTP